MDLSRILTLLGLDGPSLAPGLFGALDQDGNGALDYRELFVGLTLLLSGSREARLKAAFAMMDADGNGRVTSDEIRSFFYAIDPRTVTRAELDRLAGRCISAPDPSP